jgi:hypothetical protein
MARRGAAATPPTAAKPASGAAEARVRSRRSKAATEAARALLAQVDALGAKVALAVSDTRDSTRWALRYLEACRPTTVLVAPALNAADQLKITSAQADETAGVIRAVLDGLKLSDADFDRGITIAIDELKKVSAQGWQPL